MIKLFATRDAVPEAQRETAIETKEGKWAADMPSEEDDLGEKGKKALKAERDAREKAEKEAKDAKDALAKEQKKNKAKDAGISDDELEEMRKREELERKPILDENEKLKQENRNLKLNDHVQRLGVKHGWMEDRVKQAMRLLAGRVDLTKDEKGHVVMDEEGNITTETLDNFLSKTFKKENPWLYKGSGAKGSDTRNSEAGDDEVEVPAPVQSQAAAHKRDVVGSF